MGQINNRLGNTLLESGFFPPCRVATTGSNVALSGLLTIDGVTLVEGDRVLVKDQTDAKTNGIYAASTGAWPRTTDAQSNTQFFNGMSVVVAQGVLSSGIIYICTTLDDPVAIGTSQITFLSQTLFTAATSATSAAISTGAKSFTTQANKPFFANEWVLIYETSNSANALLAQVTSYAGTALAVTVVATGGAGTHADWTIVPTNSPASSGLMPPVGSGNVTGPGSSTANHLAVFADATGKLIADAGGSFAALFAALLPQSLTFATRTAAAAATIAGGSSWLRTAGFASAGDGGGALYSAVGGSTSGGFQSADGQWWAVSERNPSVKQFGAKGDNSTDDTAAMVLAIAYAVTNVVPLYAPSGTYKLTAQLTLPGNLTLYGASRLSTIFSFSSGLIGFFYNSNVGSVDFRHFSVTAPAGTAIQLGDASNVHTQSTLDDVEVFSSATGFNLVNCSATHLTNCFVFQFTSAAIQITAPLNTDGGDSWIEGCYIQNSGGVGGTGICINHISGGGWNILNNKMLTCLRGYFGNYDLPGGPANSVMSALHIEGNSIEGMVSDCIAIINQRTTVGDVFNFRISENEGGSSGASFLTIGASGTRTWVHSVVIQANLSNNVNGTSGFLVDGTDNFTVGGNAIREGGTPTGAPINIGSHSTNGLVVGNAIVGYGGIVNSGTNVTVLAGSNGP